MYFPDFHKKYTLQIYISKIPFLSIKNPNISGDFQTLFFFHICLDNVGLYFKHKKCYVSKNCLHNILVQDFGLKIFSKRITQGLQWITL
jgi:hypothetical protein